MMGRYGLDSLSRFLMGLWVVLAIVNIFLRLLAITVVVWVLCVLVLLRMFSRNFAARQRENALFLQYSAGARKLWKKVSDRVKSRAERFRQRKTHCFFSCPSCHATLRVPRKKGVMQIRCVRCGHEFSKKIR